MGKMSLGLYATAAGLILLLAGCGGASAGSKETGSTAAETAGPSPVVTSAGSASPKVVTSNGSSSPGTPTPTAKPTVKPGGSGADPVAPTVPSSSPAPTPSEVMSTALPNGATSSPAAIDKNSGITEEQIVSTYKAQLTDLQSYYTKQLEQLYSQIVAAKKSGKSNEDILNTFSGQVLTLEEDSQAKVNALLMQLRTELSQHQLPLDSVDTLRSAYNAAIDQTKSAYEAKAKTDLGIDG